MTENLDLTIKTKVKVINRAVGLNTTGDFGKALDEKVLVLISDACQRAKANGRKTVSSKDL